MAEYDDFHVVIQLDPQQPGSWNVLLEECPVPGLPGSKGNVQPSFTRDQLLVLRNQHGWPDLNKLESLGQSVGASLMTPGLEAALRASLAASQARNRGLRLVVSMIGGEPAPDDDQALHLQELPVEAWLIDQHNFLAQGRDSPVSRSLRFKPDREPEHVSLPLRVLVVAAAPHDKPSANIQAEKDAITNAFATLGGAFAVEFCEPPTRSELIKRLQRRFHILHFVGHGAFDPVGTDPSPLPHLCLVRAADGNSDPIDASTLDTLLRPSGIRLVVLTACSSAGPAPLTPQEVGATVGPYCGFAQRLVSGLSQVSASVAMQFDLESDAAVAFSSSFYTQLLSSDRKLDEIVTICRETLVGTKGAGHRAWVTPVIYWRCIDGKVFDIEPMRGVLDAQTRDKLLPIERDIESNLHIIADMKAQPPNVRSAIANLIASWEQKVEDLNQQRGLILGDSLRLRGGPVAAGAVIPCRLLLRLRAPAQVDDVKLHLRYPADKMTFAGPPAAGSAAPANLPLSAPHGAGDLELQINDASQGAPWPPGEYELATLSFQVAAGVTDPVLQVDLTDGRVEQNGNTVLFNTLSGMVFVA